MASRAQFMFLAINPARLYLRELHNVLRTKGSWSGRRVQMTHRLRRDFEWFWVAVPNHSTGRILYKPVETAYMHVDSSGYGWGAVLNETARFSTTADIRANRLSREIDYVEWAFNRRHFNHLDNIWGRHIIDCFATMENEWLPRYNSRWREPLQ
eukprot:jgi/Tetstr1/462399/TSEL_007405.t1